MRKFFAIFVAITLWNASALEAAVQYLCTSQTFYECNTEAEARSVNGNEYKCCSCMISNTTSPTYNCNAYEDDGYELVGTYCEKDPEYSEDDRGYKKTTYGRCLATTALQPIAKLGSIMYLYKTSDSFYGKIPTECSLMSDEIIK